MRKRLAALTALLGLAAWSTAQDPHFVRIWEEAQKARPQQLASTARIAPRDEPGQPLRIRGQVFRADGRTPAADVVVFAYHTDRTGLYHRPGEHGLRLKGWAKTDREGRFEFTTIRPAPYPDRTIPAHVHFTMEGPGVSRQWTADLMFTDDPLLPQKERRESAAAGKFAWVQRVDRAADGIPTAAIALRSAPANRF